MKSSSSHLSAFLIVSVVLEGCLVPSAIGANKYVDASAVGLPHDGSSWANAWTSFAQIAQSSLTGDDVVWVKSGTYDERFTIAKSGCKGHRISYIGAGGVRPVLRGVDGGAFTDIAIINLEITQLSVANSYDAITLKGATRWLIEDNYIHDTYMTGVNVVRSVASSNNIIRHNTFADIGSIDGGNGGGSNPNVISLVGDHNLIEYNSVAHSMDRVRAFGAGDVVRNNYWGATDSILYPNGPQYPSHTDGFQSWGGVPGSPLVQLLYERNYDTDNTDSVGGTNAHGFIVQDAQGTNGFNWAILRFNVLIRPGGGAYSFQNVSRTYVYNSTFVAIQHGSARVFQSASSYTYPNTHSAATSDLADARNNTWDLCPKCMDTHGIVSSSYWPTHFTSAAQHSYNTSAQVVLPAGASPANIAQTDPKFTDGTGIAGHDDYTLQSSSPLRGAGAPITSASSAGIDSINLNVSDARRLFDGWGIADADWIKIGAGDFVQISSIDYDRNVVTLCTARSWSKGSRVIVKGTEDVGALPYAYAKPYTVTNTTPLRISPGAAILSASCANPDAVRKVEFLVDGLPVGDSYIAPYSITWISDGERHAIEARAYSLWAGQTLSKSQVITVNTP